MADIVKLEIKKREDFTYVINVAQAELGLENYDCKNFGEVFHYLLFIREVSASNEKIKLDIYRNDSHNLESSQIKDLEAFLDMHNQLIEIKNTFEKRKKD